MANPQSYTRGMQKQAHLGVTIFSGTSISHLSHCLSTFLLAHPFPTPISRHQIPRSHGICSVSSDLFVVRRCLSKECGFHYYNEQKFTARARSHHRTSQNWRAVTHHKASWIRRVLPVFGFPLQGSRPSVLSSTFLWFLLP